MNTFTYAVQTMDLARGETEWSTQPPIRTVPTVADDAAEAAYEIYEAAMLMGYPGVPAGFDGWWTFPREGK